MSIKQVKIDSNINQLKEVSNQINNNINNEINNVETNVDFIDLDIFKKKKEKKKEINNIPKNINNEINNAKKIEKVQGKYQEKTIYYDENGEKIAEFFEETHLNICQYISINEKKEKIVLFKEIKSEEENNIFHNYSSK